MSGYSPFGGRRPEPPMPTLIETRWRVIGPSQRVITCALYQDVAGLELRCHYEESIDALVRSERVSHNEIAHDIAAAWKQAAIDKGFADVSD